VSFIPRGGWDARGRGGAAGKARSLVSALGQQGLWVRSLDNPVCLRACTHLVTRATEVDQLLSQLEHLAQAA
jgi:hypothetical protein